jgi:hypothetical protein
MENEIPMEQGGNAEDAAPLGEMNGQVIELELGPGPNQGQVVPGNEEHGMDDAPDVPFIDEATHQGLWNQLMDYLQSDAEVLPFYWHEAIRQQVWSESDLAYVMDVARTSSRSSMWLEPHLVGDPAASTRTMQLVRSFPDLVHLTLKDPDNFGGAHHPGAEFVADRVNWLLEAFLAQQKASGSLTSNLSSFEFFCDCPVSPSLLAELLDSSASTLEEFQFGDFTGDLRYLEEGLARELSGVFWSPSSSPRRPALSANLRKHPSCR